MNEKISAIKSDSDDVMDEPSSYYHVLHRLYRLEQTVFIQTNDKLTFPENDLATLIRCKQYYLLTVNFLGLIGVDAPWWLTEVKIINHVLKICRQVICQRCYELYYLAWYHTHPLLHWMDAKNKFPLSVGRSLDLTQFLYGLRQMLLAYSYQISMQPCWQTVADNSRLGANLCLGQNTLLGERIVRANQIIYITIGSLTSEELTGWLNQSLIQNISNRLFANSAQTGVRLCWQCRQRPLLDDNECRLGKALIYLGF
jgi:Type VI secretion, TssG